MNSTALVFQNTTFDVVDRNGDAWLRSPQIADALGYSQANRVADLYLRHTEEFTDDMTALVKLPTEGGEQEVRIFSPRGCYALAMFARTKVAKAFRKWVLDVLETIRKTGQYVAAPYSANPGDALTKEQADALRQIITRAAEKLPEEKRGAFIRAGWSKLKSHFKVGYRQIPATEFTEAVSLITRHAVEGEYLPREETRETESVNQTVHKWAQQIRENNSYPVQVFAPLVDALLGRAGMQLMMPPVQQAEISERLGRVISIFHPMSSQFADAQGVLRCLKGLHPETGEKHGGFRQLIAA